MKTTKCNKKSWRGYALLLAASLLIPGVSQAAIVSGETMQTTAAGDITVAVTVDDTETLISILWPKNRWIGISFGDNSTAHDLGYMIVSSLDGTFYEANAAFKAAPVEQASQDLFFKSFEFDTGDGISQLVVSRDSNTGDDQDFLFVAIEQTIQLQWALGADGDPTSAKHAIKGTFSNPLLLTAVPVPAALPLLASGLFALGLFTRRKKAV